MNTSRKNFPSAPKNIERVIFKLPKLPDLTINPYAHTMEYGRPYEHEAVKYLECFFGDLCCYVSFEDVCFVLGIHNDPVKSVKERIYNAMFQLGYRWDDGKYLHRTFFTDRKTLPTIHVIHDPLTKVWAVTTNKEFDWSEVEQLRRQTYFYVGRNDMDGTVLDRRNFLSNTSEL